MKKLDPNNFLWKTRYYEKNKKEHSVYLFNSLEIEKAIKRLFKLYKLILNDLDIKYSNSKLELFLSYYTTVQSFKLLQQTNKNKYLVLKPVKTSKNKNTTNTLFVKKRFDLLLRSKRHLLKNNFINNSVLTKNNFSEILLEILSVFTKKNLKIVLILQNLNKGISFRLKNKSAKIFKEILIQFRKFTKFFFFKETINILLLTIYKSINLKLLTEFISFQLSVIKKHNIFLIFLKQAIKLLQNSNLSAIKGIKIIIKGRLNGAPRARSKIIQNGNVPLQKKQANFFQSKSTSYTPNGTFSIKSWACVK
jgi:hypothetical protein